MPRPASIAALAESRWRRSVRELHAAEDRYQRLLESPRADEHDIDAAWLALWRAERRFDEALELADDWAD